MNLGAPEIITILVVALLIFGPKKLPELGRSLGSGIREFRKGTQGLKEELEMGFKDEPVAVPQTAPQAVATPTQTTVISAAPAAVIQKDSDDVVAGVSSAGVVAGETPKA